MNRFQKLAIAATAATLALVGVGGLVRATGSGEGCPNWPGCFPGRFLPPLRYHPLIEWSHRTLVGVDSVLIGILAVAALVAYRRVRPIVVPAVAAFGLIVAEAILGGIVVKGDLKPALVTAHRLLAAAAGLLILYTAVRAWTMERRFTDLLVFSTLALALYVVQVVLGAALVWSRLAP